MTTGRLRSPLVFSTILLATSAQARFWSIPKPLRDRLQLCQAEVRGESNFESSYDRTTRKRTLLDRLLFRGGTPPHSFLKGDDLYFMVGKQTFQAKLSTLAQLKGWEDLGGGSSQINIELKPTSGENLSSLAVHIARFPCPLHGECWRVDYYNSKLFLKDEKDAPIAPDAVLGVSPAPASTALSVWSDTISQALREASTQPPGKPISSLYHWRLQKNLAECYKFLEEATTRNPQEEQVKALVLTAAREAMSRAQDWQLPPEGAAQTSNRVQLRPAIPVPEDLSNSDLRPAPKTTEPHAQ